MGSAVLENTSFSARGAFDRLFFKSARLKAKNTLNLTVHRLFIYVLFLYIQGTE